MCVEVIVSKRWDIFGTQRIMTPTKVLVELVVSFATGLFNFVNKDFQIYRQTTSFYFTEPPRPAQLNLLPSAGREMSTGQIVAIRLGSKGWMTLSMCG